MKGNRIDGWRSQISDKRFLSVMKVRRCETSTREETDLTGGGGSGGGRPP